MADRPASDRTEEATPERLKKARKKGQIPQSQEVPSALMMAMLLVLLVIISPWLCHWFVEQIRRGLSAGLAGSMNNEAFASLLATHGKACFTALAPFLVMAVAASALGSILPGGFVVSPEAIRLELSRISPFTGIKNIVSLRSLVKLLISMTKLAVLLAVAWHYLSARIDSLIALQWATPEGILCGTSRIICGLGGRIVMALLVIAGVDMLYQRWNHKRQLRMTRQEVKEERRQYEVSPEVKRRIRGLQIAMAQRRMLQEVPTADVVVTNPTHYAVALRYDQDEMDAPKMVAKGADFLCKKIKEIARQHGVPIVERPQLARALYGACEPGQTVPETLFVAVAEVLAMIYRLRKNRYVPRAGK